MKVILEDAYQARDVRIYKHYAPAIRAEREGLKVMTDNNLILTQNKTKMKNDKANEFNGGNSEVAREILRVLWKEIGEKAFLEKVGRCKSILKEEVLRYPMYEKGICKEECGKSDIQDCTPVCETDCNLSAEQRTYLRKMWCDEEYRCSPQGRKFSQQFAREFGAFVQELSHERASQTEDKQMHYLWKLNREDEARDVREALLEMEEIWESINVQSSPRVRIRKLTARECFRLMDLTEADIDKIQNAGISKSQCTLPYK